MLLSSIYWCRGSICYLLLLALLLQLQLQLHLLQRMQLRRRLSYLWQQLLPHSRGQVSSSSGSSRSCCCCCRGVSAMGSHVRIEKGIQSCIGTRLLLLLLLLLFILKGWSFLLS